MPGIRVGFRPALHANHSLPNLLTRGPALLPHLQVLTVAIVASFIREADGHVQLAARGSEAPSTVVIVLVATNFALVAIFGLGERHLLRNSVNWYVLCAVYWRMGSHGCYVRVVVPPPITLFFIRTTLPTLSMRGKFVIGLALFTFSISMIAAMVTYAGQQGE